MLQTFDAPNGDMSCVRRSRSNTPLQALVTLNDPVFLESARALALRTLEAGGSTDAERLDFAFRRVLARHPLPAERDEFELRTSFSARLVARDARHFPATAEEYRALYENHLAQQTLHETSTRDRFNSETGRARIDASTKAALDLKAALGPARYAEWQASQRDDHRALVELQRRFPRRHARSPPRHPPPDQHRGPAHRAGSRAVARPTTERRARPRGRRPRPRARAPR
jgi:hypothetical protein